MQDKKLFVTLKNGERIRVAEMDVAMSSLRELQAESAEQLRLLCDYAKGNASLEEVPPGLVEMFNIESDSLLWQAAKAVLVCIDEESGLGDPFRPNVETDTALSRGEALKRANAARLATECMNESNDTSLD